jgi:NTP pyrophosphatase (non-canonical NTP hydrolase)
MKITEIINDYYTQRGLKFPDSWQALAFATTEMGEAYEFLLQRDGGWVRNNPESKPVWDQQAFAEELGDLIMMVVVAGIAEGVDPIQAMLGKMERKLQKAGIQRQYLPAADPPQGG